MPEHEIAFEATAAQVLPVLVVVAIVEMRLLSPPDKSEFQLGHFLFVSAFCVSAAASEIILLASLKLGWGLDPFGSAFVLLTLIVGTFLVFYSPAKQFREPLREHLRKRRAETGKADPSAEADAERG